MSHVSARNNNVPYRILLFPCVTCMITRSLFALRAMMALSLMLAHHAPEMGLRDLGKERLRGRIYTRLETLGIDLTANGVLVVPVHQFNYGFCALLPSALIRSIPKSSAPIAQPHPTNWTLGQSRSAPASFAMSPSLAFVFVL